MFSAVALDSVKMGLGVLQEKKSGHVPGEHASCPNSRPCRSVVLIKRVLGTSYVLEDSRAPKLEIIPEGAGALKYDRSGPVPIILVPQPSDDPNDPLVCNSNAAAHIMSGILMKTFIELAFVEA